MSNTWRGKEVFTKGIDFQDEKGQALRQPAAEVRFPGSGQAADDNHGRPGFRRGELPQASGQPPGIGDNLGTFHTLDYNWFWPVWLGGRGDIKKG